MSEKAKVDKPSKARVNKYGFLAMWVGAQVLGWFSVFLVFESGLGSAIGAVLGENNWTLAPVIAIAVGVPTTLIQKLALYLGFGRWFAGWTRANLIGWFLGSFGLVSLFELGIDGNERLTFMVQILTLMLLPSIAQAWILSRYIQLVWLWLAATVTGSIVLVTVSEELAGYWSIYPAFGAFALVTGLTLLWLFGMQSKEGKLKNDVDTSRLEDEREVTDEALDMQNEAINERKSESR